MFQKSLFQINAVLLSFPFLKEEHWEEMHPGLYLAAQLLSALIFRNVSRAANRHI